MSKLICKKWLQHIKETAECDNFFTVNESEIIMEKSGGFYNIFLDRKDNLGELVEGISYDDGKTFIIGGKDDLDSIKEYFPKKTIYNQYFMFYTLKEDKVFKRQPKENIVIKQIDDSWCDFVSRCYSNEEFSYKYVKYIVNKNVGFCATYDGEKAGFYLEHKNKDLGALYVLPKYRSMGISGLMVTEMLDYQKSIHRDMFCFISLSNIQSIRNAIRCGMLICEERFTIVNVLNKYGEIYRP